MKPASTPSASAESGRDLAAEIASLIHGQKSTPVPSADEKFLALNQLSGGIAHEFNNIIAGILGSAELMAMDIPEGHPAHESLKHIFEASNRARDFLHRVRHFSQRPPVQLKLTEPTPLLVETAQILRSVIPEKVSLEARLAPHCPAILADAPQLHQVILDLCLHCWQGLTDRRGHLQLTLDTIAAPVGFSGREAVQLVISDDSDGLDANALKRVFEPFHTRKATAKKIGLELFSAREVIHAHHGRITANSAPGQGLTFIIHLPIPKMTC